MNGELITLLMHLDITDVFSCRNLSIKSSENIFERCFISSQCKMILERCSLEEYLLANSFFVAQMLL